MNDVVDDRSSANDLIRMILDPRRTLPIVAVSMAESRTAPLVDMVDIRETVGSAGIVVLLRTGPATWLLKRGLPAGLDVFGDAIRVWRPGSLDAGEHPLLVLEDQPSTIELSSRFPLLPAALNCREDSAVVHSVSPDGALLRLPDDSLVVVEPVNVTRAPLPPDRVLRPAQRVRVLLIADSTAETPEQGTLLPFEDEPLDRLVQTLKPGVPVLGRVHSSSRRKGTTVELLPGAFGRVPPQSSSAEGLPSVAELLAVELAPTEALHSSPTQTERILTLRLTGQPARALSLRPDGPPWLQETPFMVELSTEQDAWSGTPMLEEKTTDPSDLEDLVSRAERAHEQSQDLIRGLDRTVEQMRTRARSLRHELEMDLADIRHRVLSTVQSEYEDLTGSSLEALEKARSEIAALRATLRESEQTKDRLRHEVSSLTKAELKHKDELTRARESIRLERARVRRLQRELDTFIPAKDRFLRALYESWLRQTDREDRQAYPWREPLIGEHFFDSLDRVQGIGAERIIDVCAEVVSGRAAQRTGFQVHPIRSSSGGGSAQLVRSDGARAFRASLQVRSSAARRLHYWQLKNGHVELAQIGYHDDFSIH